MTEKETFESWAIIELFGRQKIAGKVTEAFIGGCAFLRCDVPASGKEGEVAYTKFYGNGAIYSMTPVTEQVAVAFLDNYRPEPVSTWDLPKALTPPSVDPYRDERDEETVLNHEKARHAG